MSEKSKCTRNKALAKWLLGVICAGDWPKIYERTKKKKKTNFQKRQLDTMFYISTSVSPLIFKTFCMPKKKQFIITES